MNTAIEPQRTEDRPSRELIAALAYQLWENGGHQPNRDLEYWFRAEKLVKPASAGLHSHEIASNPEQDHLLSLQAPRPINCLASAMAGSGENSHKAERVPFLELSGSRIELRTSRRPAPPFANNAKRPCFSGSSRVVIVFIVAR
jgi:hypothetical protein